MWVSNDHIEEDSVEKYVGLSVDGRESHLVFIDHGHGTMKLENLGQGEVTHQLSRR